MFSKINRLFSRREPESAAQMAVAPAEPGQPPYCFEHDSRVVAALGARFGV